MNNYQDILIGMFMVQPALLKSTILQPNYFDKVHRKLFVAIKNSYSKNGIIVYEDLAVDGLDFDLAVQCAEATATISNFDYYQEYALRKYKEKAIIAHAKKIATGDIGLDEFYKAYENVRQLGVVESTKLDKKTLIQSLTTNKKNIKFEKFKYLEKKLNLKENDFMILAGGTGIGKSAVALNLLMDLSHNYPCLFFNLEMVEQEVHQRMIAIDSKITINRLEDYEHLPQKALDITQESINKIDSRKIDISNKSVTLDKLRNKIMTYKSDKHFIVFIDHLGLVGVKAKSSYERMTEVAKELRKISLDNNCTIIGLSQLNRDSSKGDSKPNLSMLRDSGELEQSASKVVFVWLENGAYSMVIEKNRSAPKAIVPIGYNKENQVIFELDRQS